MTIAIGRDDEINLHLLQVDGSYATRLWGSSIGLARWLTEDFEVLNATEIALELGCGSGLVSLALAKVGAAQKVVATDIDSSSLALIQQASMLNHVQVSTELLNICGAEPLPSADIVVASDVLYTESLAEGLAARCIEALDAGSQVVIGEFGVGYVTRVNSMMQAADALKALKGDSTTETSRPKPYMSR
jgi:predicted nicotinamide N-methyase